MKIIMPSIFEEMLKSTEIHSYWHFEHYPLSCFFIHNNVSETGGLFLHPQVALTDRANLSFQTLEPTQGWIYTPNPAGPAGLMHMTF
jgi:hypothetical protein